MPQDHWIHETGTHGCQHPDCREPATVQWQRKSTPQEAASIQELYRRTGINLRADDYTTAVFACDLHTLDEDRLTLQHQTRCPAPDAGCDCA